MAIPIQKLEGKYEILEKIREGGMGAIYRVRHRLLGEERVVKVMRPHLRGDSSLRDRFLAEARSATQLSHPNIAQIFDCTIDEDGVAYIVMELIRGRSLEEVLASGEPVPLALALEIARQSLRAIGHIHQHDVAHRDISPDNLMLTCDIDSLPLVKVIDLGIAKDKESAGPMTGEGVFLGKLRYGAPEAFEDTESVDRRRSDLYSFGLVLYELLTGTFPISGRSPSSLIAGHLFRPPLDFAESDPAGRIPEAIRQAVLKALAKSPAERFADAESFAAALSAGCELDLETPEVRRILDRIRAPGSLAFRPSRRPGSTQSRLDRHFLPEPTPLPAESTFITSPEADVTRILRSVPAESTAAETAVLAPLDSEVDPEATMVLAREETAETAVIEPTIIGLRQTPGVSPTSDEPTSDVPSTEVLPSDVPSTEVLPSEAPTEHNAEVTRIVAPEVLQELRLEASRTQGGGAPTEEDTTVAIHSLSSGPGETSDTVLEQAVAEIRRLRDAGKAGEALKELNRFLRELGPLEVLQTLRYELGEALLERDAEEEDTASRMFEAVVEPEPPDPPPAVPRPIDPAPVPAAPAPPPAAAVSSSPPAAVDLAAEPLQRSLDDATIRSLDALPPPAPERPEPPVAHPNRNLVAVGFVLAAVFALVVYLLIRQGPVSEGNLEVEDVEAQAMSPGSVVLDAAPWAEIVGLENPDLEDDPPISPSRFTPVVLSLPPGEYRITLRYPPSGEEKERIIRVESDQRIDERVIFQTLDGQQYFERIGW